MRNAGLSRSSFANVTTPASDSLAKFAERLDNLGKAQVMLGEIHNIRRAGKLGVERRGSRAMAFEDRSWPNIGSRAGHRGGARILSGWNRAWKLRLPQSVIPASCPVRHRPANGGDRPIIVAAAAPRHGGAGKVEGADALLR
jgi:hypothetical protein